MIIPIRSSSNVYDIHILPGGLKKIQEFFDTNRKVLIVTDDGVPSGYADVLAAQCRFPVVARVGQGERSKSIETWKELLCLMLENGFTRSDAVIALGGGVCGDLAGFTAASFMRGIDFCNIPTTVLSQVDSSIGGKTAVNLNGIKNIVGAFYPPQAVLIDTDLLSTLPARQISNGLAEAVKMAVTFDEDLFSLIENGEIGKILPEVIRRSLLIKKDVVEKDEKESGLRKVLNFGHTIGHGIESVSSLYHGECVSLGMLPMCSDEVRSRLLPVLRKLNLPTECSADEERVFEALSHDKKSSSDGVTAIFSDKIGQFRAEKVSFAHLREKYNAYFGE